MTDEYLAHHGILGQKWGVRRYQNPDGTLTAAGKKHYARQEHRETKKEAEKALDEYRYSRAAQTRYLENWRRTGKKIEKAESKGKNTDKLRNEHEKYEDLLDRSNNYTNELMRKADKAVGNYIRKYGQEKAKSLSRQQEKELYTMGKNRAERILRKEANRGALVGQFIGGIPGSVLGSVYGAMSDLERFQAYESTINQKKYK